MLDQIFDWFAQVLVYWAGFLGITYKETHVVIFVVISPLLTMLLISVIVIQRQVIRRLLEENQKPR